MADLQNGKDKRKITIDKVGVKGIKYPVVVSDRSNKTQATIADINLYVELPHYHRGTHMSRFVEVLNRYHQEEIVFHLQNLLDDLRQSLNANAAYIEMNFPYFISKAAPVSGIESFLNYECMFKAALKDEYEFWIGVKVPVTTLCPCSKEISDYGAHNQRSEVSLTVQYSEFMWLEELIDLIENTCSCDIYPLLKRVDEKYVTEKAYDHPMFVEDIVRELTLALQKDKRVLHFEIESENFESIHNHSAYAYMRR